MRFQVILIQSEGHARTLAEDGQQRGVMSPNLQRSFSPIPDSLTTSTSSLHLPSSPRKRLSFGASGGNTTKVLADLQAGVINAKNALENTKAQLRMSQRTVAQLTRQTEDLKDGRERLRLENEGLNNVVARKERLLQEVSETLPCFYNPYFNIFNKRFLIELVRLRQKQHR